MKNFFRLSACAFAAAALFSACSSEENNAPDQGGEKGDYNAYLKVNVRATEGGRGTDGGYVYGNADEHNIKNAMFFFYDANGLFMLQASVWDGGTASTHVDGTPDGNIELMGNNVLVLEGLGNNTTPTYMLTVLNAPSDFAPAATLADTRAKLMDLTTSLGGENCFIMSTSSYVGGSDQYGTNKLAASDFLVQAPGTALPTDLSTINTVNVYVERLAAKVEVAVDATADKTIGTTKYYKINASVGGNTNTEGDDYEGVTELYVTFNGWALTGTPTTSYLTKNIEGWADGDTPFAGWNKATDFRSFWGKSVVYGTTPALEYVGYNKANTAFGNVLYTHENTNSIDKITNSGALIDANVTSVVFTATVVTIDGSDVAPADLVRYNGVLYTKNQYFAYALNNLNNRNKLNYWKKVSDTEYVQMNAGELKLALVQPTDAGTGMVKISTNLVADTDKYYVRSGAGVEGDPYTWAEQTFTTATIDALKAELAKFNGSSTDVLANAYTGGAQFYAIPIEHLAAFQAGDDAELVEGNYGVVRNHWYRLNVSSVTTLGHGVFNPGTGTEDGEPLIPDDPQDPSYYLGATINVLSWKLVTQNVGL